MTLRLRLMLPSPPLLVWCYRRWDAAAALKNWVQPLVIRLVACAQCTAPASKAESPAEVMKRRHAAHGGDLVTAA